MVDYPGEVSLKQIYGTYNRAVLKVVPSLRAYAELLTDAMVAFTLHPKSVSPLMFRRTMCTVLVS